MICKTFKGGKSARGAGKFIDYLLNERVENGTSKCIVGNPELTKKIINNLDFEFKYTNGVMSFEEVISPQERDEIIQHFRDTFFCGLSENQYNLLIVEHQDKCRTELHFIIPKVELSTGLSFNPYYAPKDFNKKDLFQDFINAKYELSSPHEIEKKELTKLNTSNKKELQNFIDNFVKEELEKGTISNAEELKNALKKLGFSINRQGKNYIGLEIDGQKIRMKGSVYGKDFRGVEQVEREQREIQSRHIPGNGRELEKIEQKLQKIIKKQAEFNQKKYAYREHNHLDLDNLQHIDISNAQQLESTRTDEKYTSGRQVPNDTKRELNTNRPEPDIPVQTKITKGEDKNDRIRADIRREAERRAKDKRRAYEEARRARESLYRRITEDISRQQKLKRGFGAKISGFGEKIREFIELNISKIKNFYQKLGMSEKAEEAEKVPHTLSFLKEERKVREDMQSLQKKLSEQPRITQEDLRRATYENMLKEIEREKKNQNLSLN